MKNCILGLICLLALSGCTPSGSALTSPPEMTATTKENQEIESSEQSNKIQENNTVKTKIIEPSPYYVIMNSSGKKGVITEDGKQILACDYENITFVNDIESGDLIYFNLFSGGDPDDWKDNYSALASPKGEILTGFDFQYYISGYYKGLLLHTLPNGARFINAETFETVLDLRKDTYGLMPLFTEKGIGTYDHIAKKATFYSSLNGKLSLIKELKNIDQLINKGYPAIEACFPIMQKGIWGYCDDSGEMLIDFEYNEAHVFSEGLAAVLVGADTKSVMENDGKKVYFSEGGKWGFIDISGKIIIEPFIPYENNQVENFINGECKIRDAEKYTYYVIDKTGKILRENQSETIASNGSQVGYAQNKKDDLEFVLNRKDGTQMSFGANVQGEYFTSGIVQLLKLESGITIGGIFDVVSEKWLVPLDAYSQVIYDFNSGMMLAKHHPTKKDIIPVEKLVNNHKEFEGDLRIAEFALRSSMSAPTKCDILAPDGSILLSGIENVLYFDGARIIGYKDGAYCMMDISGNIIWSE